MTQFLLHSLLLVARTPTCNCVYQVWYFFGVYIIKRGGMADESLNRKYRDGVKIL